MTREDGDDRRPGGPGAEPSGGGEWWRSGQRTAAPGFRGSSTTSAKGARPRRRRVSVRPLFLLPFGAGAMFGSMSVWISFTSANHTSTFDGTYGAIRQAYGVNGWDSFAAGAVLVGAGLILAVWRSPVLKLLAFLGALAGLGVGAYDLVRILHDMSQAHSKTVQPGSLAAQLPGSTSIGYGLIVLVAASFIGLLLTLSDIDRSR